MHCGYMPLLIPRRLIDWFGHCEAALRRAENLSNEIKCPLLHLWCFPVNIDMDPIDFLLTNSK